MGKIVKADGSASADAYAAVDLVTPQPEVWVTTRLRIEGATLAAFFSPWLISVFPAIGVNPDGSTMIDGASLDPTNWITFYASSGPAADADVWITVEFHHVNGGDSEIYIDGTLATNGTDPGSGDVEWVSLGQFQVGGETPPSVCYYDDFKVGTTRGASDLFADDFESGDFTAWDSTGGDITVIDSPFADELGSPLDYSAVSVAPSNNALDEDPDWVRLDSPDAYRVVTGWSLRRGRESELDKTDTGTATIQCKDSEGILDPTNAFSPFYGQLEPQKPARIQIRNPFTGIFHTIFRGFVDFHDHDLVLWREDPTDQGLDTATLEFYDGFGFLSGVELMPGVHGDTPSSANFPDVYYQGTPSNVEDEPDVFVHVDDRIVKLLDDAGWPNTGLKRVGLRDIYSGNVSMQGVVVDRGDGLMSALQDAVDAELPGGANHYMSKEGVYRFRGRFSRINPETPGYGIGFWTVGSVSAARADSSIAMLSALSFRRAKDDIYNSVLALPQNATDADIVTNLVEDSDSITAFGRRGLSFPDLLTSAGHHDGDPTTAQEETQKFGDFYVQNRKNPGTRVTRLAFVGRWDDLLGPAIWDLMCGVEIGDVITLQTSHPGGGGFDEDFFVEGISYEAEFGQALKMQLEVSPRVYWSYNPFGDVDTGLE